MLQQLFAFTRLEKEFGAKVRAIIAVALAPLQKNLGTVRLLVAPSTPCNVMWWSCRLAIGLV